MNFETIESQVGVRIELTPKEVTQLLSALRVYVAPCGFSFEGLINFLSAVQAQNMLGVRSTPRPTLELPDLGGSLL